MKVMSRTKYVQGTHFVSSNATDPQNMFNDTILEKSTRSGDMTVVLTPGTIYSIAFAGLEGNSITVVGETGSPSTEVFRHEQDLRLDIVRDWFEYFFEPFSYTGDVFVQVGEAWAGSVPPDPTMTVTITIEGANTACGVCAFGRMYEIGTTQLGISYDLVDYSTKETDATTGVTTFAEGPYSKRISASIFADNADLQTLTSVAADMRATPTFWNFASGTDYEGVFVVFGFFRDLSIVIPYPNNFLCSLDIEGLI